MLLLQNFGINLWLSLCDDLVFDAGCSECSQRFENFGERKYRGYIYAITYEPQDTKLLFHYNYYFFIDHRIKVPTLIACCSW